LAWHVCLRTQIVSLPPLFRVGNTKMDIDQLSESQQLALQQYTSVTDQEATAAIPLLQRSQWNVEVRSSSSPAAPCAC
jgi:hypothetical protein